MTPETLEYYILLGLLIVVGVCMLLALVRCICGPKIGDRIVAVNMTNTLAVMGGEGYLADVCLIYVMIGFLAVVALCRVFIKRARREDYR